MTPMEMVVAEVNGQRLEAHAGERAMLMYDAAPLKSSKENIENGLNMRALNLVVPEEKEHQSISLNGREPL